MDTFVKKVFLRELKKQAEFAVNSFKEMDEALSSQSNREFFRYVHRFLAHVGCISKILWPSKQGCIQRGNELRKILNISKNHYLKDRKLRNHLEHFDERLDYWAENGMAGASRKWGCPVYGSVFFMGRKIPESWPSGVLANENNWNMKTWRYVNNLMKISKDFSPKLKEGRAVVNIFFR